MFKYAIKSLIQDRSKLLLSILGVAVAILLILIMEGIFAGTQKQLTAYMDNNPVDIFVLQDGVKNMHMAKTVIPSNYQQKVEEIKGVKNVIAVNYITLNVKLDGKNVPSYLIGWDQNEKIGGPWSILEGRRNLKEDETIVDKVIADKYDLDIGDKIKIMGQEFKIVGLTEGTFSMVSSIFFFNLNAFKSKLPPDTLSYLLVEKKKGVNTINLVKRINNKLDKAHALSRSQFTNNERNVAAKMGVEVIQIMTFISILAAIAVVGLSIYSATIEKIRDFGVLKAIGASKNRLYSAVISQALFSTIVAALIGALLGFGLAGVLKVAASEVLIIISLASFIKALVISIFIGVLAAYLPVRQISGIDPAIVFKG